MPDIPHRGLAQSPRTEQSAQIPLHQRHTCAFYGRIRPCSHRNSDVSQRQGRGIINTITGHRDHAALRLKPGNDLSLLRRQDIRHDILNAKLPGHRLCRIAMISRHHDDVNAFCLQLLHCLTSRGFNRISHANYAGNLLIDGNKQGCLPFTAKRRRLFVQRRETLTGYPNVLLQECRRPNGNATTSDRPGHTLPRH